MTLIPLWSAVRRTFGALPRWVTKCLAAWFKWFWRLAIPGKIAVTAIEVIILWVASSHLPITVGTQKSVVAGGGVGLAFLLIAGVLFGHSPR
jgi:hypothetical protein